jgi:hypothetical protein
MKNSIALCFTFAGLIAGLALPAIAAEKVEQSLNGLQLLEQDRRGAIFADPNVNWSSYTEIQLLDTTVSFRKNWQRDQNRGAPFKVKASDMEKIKQDLSEMFRQVFTEELTVNGGYTMVTGPEEHVLTIRPAIVDLDVAAPDTKRAGVSQQYTESAGRMTLKLELLDSVTGDLLAASIDGREAPRRGYMQWTTSATNKAEAKRLLKTWAKDLRLRLDKARAAPPPAATGD